LAQPAGKGDSVKIYDMMCPSVDAGDTGERVTDGLDGFERARWHTATVYGSEPHGIAQRLLRHSEDTGQYGLTLVDCERLEAGGEFVAPLESLESLTWHAAMAGAAQLLPEPVTFWRGLHHGGLPDGVKVNPAHYPHTSLCPPSDRVYWRPHWTQPIVRIDPRVKLWFVSPTIGGAGSGRDEVDGDDWAAVLGAVVPMALRTGADIVLWDAPAGREYADWWDMCSAFAGDAHEAARIITTTRAVMNQ
jgi:hypothetical protein